MWWRLPLGSTYKTSTPFIILHYYRPLYIPGYHRIAMRSPGRAYPVAMMVTVMSVMMIVGADHDPFYADPLFDAAHDAEFVWHEGEQCWWMIYLQVRLDPSLPPPPRSELVDDSLQVRLGPSRCALSSR